MILEQDEKQTGSLRLLLVNLDWTSAAKGHARSPSRWKSDLDWGTLDLVEPHIRKKKLLVGITAPNLQLSIRNLKVGIPLIEVYFGGI